MGRSCASPQKARGPRPWSTWPVGKSVPVRVSTSQLEGCVSNSQTLSDSPLCSLGKIVSLNCLGKKHISGVGMPLIAVAKIIKKPFWAHLVLFFNVQWGIFNNCHKLQPSN